MVKRLIAVILVAFAVFSCTIPAAAAYEPTTFEVTAKAAMLVSLDNGDVLYSKTPMKEYIPPLLLKL